MKIPWFSFLDHYNGGYRIFGPITVTFQRHWNSGHVWTPLIWCWVSWKNSKVYARREYLRKMRKMSNDKA